MISMYGARLRAVATGWWLPRGAWAVLAALGMFGAAALSIYSGRVAVGGTLVVVSAGTLAGMLTWWLLGHRVLPADTRPVAPDAWLLVGAAADGGASAECCGCAEHLAYVPKGSGFAGDNLRVLWVLHRARCPRRGLEPVRAAR